MCTWGGEGEQGGEGREGRREGRGGGRGGGGGGEILTKQIVVLNVCAHDVIFVTSLCTTLEGKKRQSLGLEPRVPPWLEPQQPNTTYLHNSSY